MARSVRRKRSRTTRRPTRAELIRALKQVERIIVRIRRRSPTQLGALLSVLGLGMAWPVGVQAQPAAAHLVVHVHKTYMLSGQGSKFITGPINALHMDVFVENQDRQRSLLVQPGFFKALGWYLLRSVLPPLKPVAIEWSDAVSCGSQARGCTHGSAVTVPPGDEGQSPSTHSAVTLRFDRQLGPGEYRLGYIGIEAHRLLTETDGSPWQGAFLEQGSVPLTVITPTSEEELREHYETEGGEAIRERDYQKALNVFRAMAKALPNDAAAVAAIGRCLLNLGRYREAADALQTSLRMRKSVDGDSLLPKELAVAYLALGRQADAEAILRAYYGERAPLLLADAKKEAELLLSKSPR